MFEEGVGRERTGTKEEGEAKLTTLPETVVVRLLFTVTTILSGRRMISGFRPRANRAGKDDATAAHPGLVIKINTHLVLTIQHYLNY